MSSGGNDLTDVGAQGATLQGYLRVLRRRIWVIVLTIVLVGLAVTLFTLRQAPLYEATAEVLLSRQNLAATLTDTQDPLASQEAERAAQTQADLARVPKVARRVIRATRIARTPEQLLAASSVSPKRDSDLLIFEVSDGDAEVASRLVAAHAREFTRYRRELDTIAYRRARRGVESRIARLEAEGSRRTPLYAALVATEQQLRTLETLQISNTEVVRAGEATQVRPTPKRNAILGLALGLVLGIGLGFLREALDVRIRSGEEIVERVGLPLLARIPEPRRRLRTRAELVMIAEPTGSGAEAFRMLRTNIEFTNLDRGARTIMVTSALEGEGKSTTVANLAVAYGRAGKHVALVDLDVRRPFLDRFFQLEGVPGLTDVALGQAKLEDAIAHVSVSGGGGKRGAQERAEGNGTATVEGVVDVLPSGPLPPDAGEFVGTQAITDILQQLRERYELVLVDAPPLLHVGDAMTLAAKVDGLLLVSSLRRARRPVLTELRRILQTLPTIKLGVVVTAAQLEENDRSRDADYYRRSLPRPPAREPRGVRGRSAR